MQKREDIKHVKPDVLSGGPTRGDKPGKCYSRIYSRMGVSESKSQSSRWTGCPGGPREEQHMGNPRADVGARGQRDTTGCQAAMEDDGLEKML